MSMREWRASRSSIWSRKPMPVATLATPDPSRFTATSMSVSLVLRLRLAVRMQIGLESLVLVLVLLQHGPARRNRDGPAIQVRALSGSCAENAPFYQAGTAFATAVWSGPG